jgi:hypothetical protein
MWIAFGGNVEYLWLRFELPLVKMWIAFGGDVDCLWLRCGLSFD